MPPTPETLLKEMAESPAPSIDDIQTRCDVDERDLEVSLMSAENTNPKPEAPSLSAEHVTVDGIEGKYARIELPDGTTADWLLSTLPDGVKEGDILAVSDEGNRIEIDHAETQSLKAQAQAKLEALNQAAPSGEITL